MRTDIKQEMLEYFKNKPNKTEQENRFLLYLQNEIEFFNITSVSRDDVDGLGFDGANMTDAQMERLADKMENAYLANGYWEDLRCCAEYMEIPKLNDIMTNMSEKVWQKVLEDTNEKLKPRNISLVVIPEDNTFNLEIHYYNSVETYASGYFEDELEELISDAYCYLS